MDELLVFALAFAPGLFWLWFFLKRNVYRPEPHRLIASTFLLGVGSTIPAGILNELFLDEALLDSGVSDLTSLAVGMLLVVGPVEEVSKFLAVRLHATRSLYFEEPTDGLVYSTAASLGFASLENVLYILRFGPAVMIGRAPLSTVAHVLFASFWGSQLGRNTQTDTRRWSNIWIGLAAAAILHGLFNVAVTVAPLSGLLIAPIAVWWIVRRFKWGQQVSPFRLKRNIPRTACDQCGARISVASSFCSRCGAMAPSQPVVIWCGRCGHALKTDAAYCTKCGDRLERV